MIVHVLMQADDDGYFVIGVYASEQLAVQARTDLIREYFDIAEDEVADDDLEHEVSDSCTFEICSMELVTK